MRGKHSASIRKLQLVTIMLAPLQLLTGWKGEGVRPSLKELLDYRQPMNLTAVSARKR